MNCDKLKKVIAEMTNGGVDRSVECTGSIQAMISAFECVHDVNCLPQAHALLYNTFKHRFYDISQN